MRQIVVWEGTIVGKDKIKEFESWMKENGFKVKYLTEFTTLPDKHVKGTGGRNDLLFEIDSKSTGKFSLWRLNYGMRWWEDYLDNGSYKIVPPEILKQYEYGWDDLPDKYVG